MNQPFTHGDERRVSYAYRVHASRTFGLSLSAVIASFLLSLYVHDVNAKAIGFSAVLVLFLLGWVGLYFYAQRERRTAPVEAQPTDDEVDRLLQSLDDAREFFGGSLRMSDTFRLVANRVSALVDATSFTLLVFDDAREALLIAESNDPTLVRGERLSKNSGIVDRCCLERDVAVDEVSGVAAIPLKRDAEVFGVLLLELTRMDRPSKPRTESLLDAIGVRVGPLVLSTIAHERSHTNALTDGTTELPNERAFHLVLENQVAESIRKGSSRPLTILSFDIKGFDDLNDRFGLAAANRLLNFVAQGSKESLRQMDFLARGLGDEFLVVLPTASKEISHDIIARINAAILHHKIAVSDVETASVELNFGWATFGLDGETPRDLLAAARERRIQGLSTLPGSVLWFSQELSH